MLQVLLATLTFLGSQEIQPALKQLDPVELCRGKETLGADGIAVEYGRYRYAFHDEENRKLFLADPERFAIQLGGACGRMGPSSGRGGPDRFAVHDGRIYVFASDVCRETFMKEPSVFLDPDEAPAQGDDAARQRGRDLIEAAVAFHGGAAHIDGLKTLVLRSEWDQTQNGETTRRVRGWTIAFPDSVRFDDDFGEWRSARVIHGSESFSTWTGGGPEDEHASSTRDLLRKLAREPLVILRARTQPDFVAVSLGEPPLPAGVSRRPAEELRVESVIVSFDGTRAELLIRRNSGEIVAATFRGRGPRMAYGTLTRRYEARHDDPSGLRVPTNTSSEFEGVKLPDLAGLAHTVRVNTPLAPETFARPTPR